MRLTPLLLLFPALAVASSARWMDLSPEERDRELTRLPQGLPDRLLAASDRFLKTPYVLGPLGEGQGKDPDPLIRFDAVDCLTFVETTMALALAKDPKDVLPVLTRIRYEGGDATYDARNHITEAQWVPSNEAKGFVTDVTDAVGGKDAVAVSKTFTQQTWAGKQGVGLGVAQGHQVHGTYRWRMIPIGRFAQVAHRAPSGSIITVVREDLPENITRISHVGFLFHDGQRTFIRHASSADLFGKQVVDEPLDDYVARNKRFQKWPVVGFSLYALKGP